MIGIIVAEEKELIEVKKIIKNIVIKNIFEKEFYIGNVEGKNVALVKANVGKVNSARICQILIDNFDIELIINVGTAGSVNNDLEIGDVVVATKLVQYDFDVTIFGRKLGEIENIGESIKVDKKLLELFDNNIYKGVIATGDKFITEIEEKTKIREQFNALCIEMEGASIAQACFLCNIPFIVIRSITDKLDESVKIDFETFLSSSSKKATKILKEFIIKYKKSIKYCI